MNERRKKWKMKMKTSVKAEHKSACFIVCLVMYAMLARTNEYLRGGTFAETVTTVFERFRAAGN